MADITITIPSDHPAFRCLGGNDFVEAANDLVIRARQARALTNAPSAAQTMMRYYFAADSGSSQKGELADKLSVMGVTDFSGIDWNQPTKLKGSVIARVHVGKALVSP